MRRRATSFAKRLRFQSPSLRGSGRFWPQPPTRRLRSSCFNPLHCGAVVASCSASDSSRPPRGVSIPFIAGQWSLQGGANNGSAERPMFQSPSLRGSGRFFKALTQSMMSNLGFNPLHCGAVVASGQEWRSYLHSQSFNPLHCGAVVASPPSSAASVMSWSCFNPLHCGAVVASRWPQPPRSPYGGFQSPSLRGSGRFPSRGKPAR